MEILKFALFLLFNNILLGSSLSNNTCLNDEKKYFFTFKPISNDYNVNFSIFKNFNSFEDLRLNCEKSYEVEGLIEFIPKNEIMIDKSFEIFPELIVSSIDKQSLALIFHTIKGFENNFYIKNPFSNGLRIAFSKFDFYLNSTLIGEEDCDKLIGAQSFFKNFKILIIDDSKYPNFICPTIFKTTRIKDLSLYSISNSLIIKNRLNFLNVTTTEDYSIRNLLLSISYETLNTRIINKNLLKNMKTLKIFGVIFGIDEPEIFKDFGLIQIVFNLENFREFFHSGTGWMKYLNNKVSYKVNNLKFDPSKILVVKFDHPKKMGSFNPIYLYPDSDFCLFTIFPHKHLVFTALPFYYQVECTCTIRFLTNNNWMHGWLVDNTNKDHYDISSYNYLSLEIFNKTHQYCTSLSYNTSLVEACDFKKMISTCITNNFTQAEPPGHQLTDTDVFYILKWLQFILLVVSKPIVCFISLISNSMTILVVKNKRKKKFFKDVMYKYIFTNAIINILFTLVVILKLMNECIFYGSNLFCSKIYQTVEMQYFKMYVYAFFGNVLRTCASLTYLSISMSRIILVRERITAGSFLDKFQHFNYKILTFIFVILSCLISFYKLFQYALNEMRESNSLFPYEISNEKTCAYFKTFNFRCNIFKWLKFFDIFLNDLLFFILNLIIDVVLYFLFKKEIEKKKLVTSANVHDLEEKQKDLNKMLLINGCVYFMSHFPQFLLTLLMVLNLESILNFCLNKLSCDMVNEITGFFSMLIITFQYFIFLRFNHNIRNSFDDLKKYYFKKLNF
jgi:hypothetical protein